MGLLVQSPTDPFRCAVRCENCRVPFLWRRIVGTCLGVAMGVVSIPFALGLSMMVLYLVGQLLPSQVGPSDMTVEICWIILIFLMSSSVAYVGATTGRPTVVTPGIHVAPAMTMKALNQNLLEIEKIVGGRLCKLGGQIGFDVGAAQSAGILSQDQAARLECVFQMQRARSVLHSDVELWARRSCELLDEIRRQLATTREPMIATEECDQQMTDDGNSYTPPASGSVSP